MCNQFEDRHTFQMRVVVPSLAAVVPDSISDVSLALVICCVISQNRFSELDENALTLAHHQSSVMRPVT